MNIIFTGDFGQLYPVHDPPLYSHNLVQNPGLQDCKRQKGISALRGVYLWHLINTVVLLKKNERQSGDRVYADLLSCIHIGEANLKDTDNMPSDFNILKTRYMDCTGTNPAQCSRFTNADR